MIEGYHMWDKKPFDPTKTPKPDPASNLVVDGLKFKGDVLAYRNFLIKNNGFGALPGMVPW